MAKRKSLKDRASNFQPTVEAQEKAIEELENKGLKKTVRVSVDFPRELYNRMGEHVKDKGQTKKGFIIHLVREYLKNQ